MEKGPGEDTIQAAQETRQHQGNHEAEATFGGEADLHKHFRGCEKNPGHPQFIPIQHFKFEHLPPDYRDDLVLDFFKAEADLTCRLSVRYTSENRPKYDPEHPHLYYAFYQDRGSKWMRVGTGWVDHVDIYLKYWGKNCKCYECNQPDTQSPKKEWGKVYIRTASHVVFDSDEARNTTCHFFYDEAITYISQCPSLKGLKVLRADIKKDSCLMECVSHDMDLLKKLEKMFNNRHNLREKVYKKYKSNINVSCFPDPTSRLTVIISHPHGLNKQFSVGMWTHRQISLPRLHKSESGFEFVNTSYRYNTATCPGSSGAPVIRLTEFGWGRWYRHLHSEGGDGNNNKSGITGEYLPTSSVVTYT